MGEGVGPGELCGRSIKYSPFFPTSTLTLTRPLVATFVLMFTNFHAKMKKLFSFVVAVVVVFGGHKVVRKSAAKLKL